MNTRNIYIRNTNPLKLNFEHIGTIKEVILNDLFINQVKDVKQLFQLKTTEYLEIQNNKISSIGKFNPQKCNLVNLDISRNNLSPASLLQISLFPHLRHISVSNCNIIDLQWLNNTQLHSINLSQNKINNQQLGSVFESKSLMVLKLSGCGIQNISFNPANCLCQELHLDQNPISNDLVSQIFSIRTLEICDVSNCSLLEIPCLPIESKISDLNLSLNQNMYLNQIWRPQFCSKVLKKLNVQYGSSIDIDFSQMKSQLKNLILSTDENARLIFDVSDECVRQITLMDLESLDFSYHHINQQLIQPLFTHHSLQSLSLSLCTVTDSAYLPPFDPQLSLLSKLAIPHTNLDQKSVELIARLPLLTSLNIVKSCSDSVSLSTVFGIENLTELEVCVDQLFYYFHK